MAGSYPDMPSRRMAYDGDQTVHYVFAGDTGSTVDVGLGGIPPNDPLVEATLTEKQEMNDDTNAGLVWGTSSANHPMGVFWFMFFPEGREIDGYYINNNGNSMNNGGAPNLAKSTDTTNGIDGTWTPLGSEILTYIDVKPDYRNSFQTTAESNIVALSYNNNGRGGLTGGTAKLAAFHVYGGITPGNTPDHLQFLDTLQADAEFTVPLDYGNVGRGTLDIRTIKIKNNSGGLTANTVQITAEDLVGGTPSGWFTFSTDGINDQATKALGSIGPGGTVTVYVHLTIPDAASLNLYQPRLMVNQASWS